MKQFRFQGSALSFEAQVLWATLSEREKQIALLVAQGKRTREIAAELCISPKTVNTHLNIFLVNSKFIRASN